MKYEIVHIDNLKARYRVIYLAPLILGVIGGLLVGMIATYFLIELFELATDTRGGKAAAGIVYLLIWVLFFAVFASATIGTMILLRIISQSEGVLMLSGRGVPNDWYRPKLN